MPDEIPESFVVDVTELMIGQSKRASDVTLTGSMKLLSPPDAVIMARGGDARRKVAPAAAGPRLLPKPLLPRANPRSSRRARRKKKPPKNPRAEE